MGVGKEISKLLHLEKSCSDFETLLHALRGRGALLSHTWAGDLPAISDYPTLSDCCSPQKIMGRQKLGKGIIELSHFNILYHERHYCHNISFIYTRVKKQPLGTSAGRYDVTKKFYLFCIELCLQNANNVYFLMKNHYYVSYIDPICFGNCMWRCNM